MKSGTELGLLARGWRGEKAAPCGRKQGSEAIALSKLRASLRYRSWLKAWRNCPWAARHLAWGCGDGHRMPRPYEPRLAEMRR
jgi:hypothetical protein